MSLSWMDFVFILSLFCLISTISVADEEFEGLSTLIVEHTLDSGPSPVFTRRGTITIRSLKSNNAHFSQASSLNTDERNKLQALVRSDGVYRVRVPTKLGASPDDKDVQFVSSFLKACSLYESKLSDQLTVNVDQSGNVIGISITTHPAICVDISVPDMDITNFNTSVDVVQTVAAPVPDTQSYIQKMEQEKAEKAKGQQPDNRSFLAKYWMYIVPLFIFMMFASSADPGQGGGGGR